MNLSTLSIIWSSNMVFLFITQILIYNVFMTRTLPFTQFSLLFCQITLSCEIITLSNLSSCLSSSKTTSQATKPHRITTINLILYLACFFISFTLPCLDATPLLSISTSDNRSGQLSSHSYFKKHYFPLLQHRLTFFVQRPDPSESSFLEPLFICLNSLALLLLVWSFQLWATSPSQS